MKISRFFFAVFFALAALLSVDSRASIGSKTAFAGLGEQFGLSPFYEWKTLTTEHFRITYPKELQELADIAARDLEESHQLLSPLMQWTPRLRTQVVLVDNSDFANGLTAAAARLGLVLWATPPDNWMSIAHYDDWFKLLCLHEYAHFLNLDATRGFWASLRILAGDSTLPNSLWPSWMLEGLAVTVETAFTKAGRGRSSYYAMILRAAEESGRLSKISALEGLSGPRSESPGGEIPYLFGYAMMSTLAKQGLSKLGDISTESSSSFPWRLNSYAQEVSGKDWSTLWKEWALDASSRARSQISAVRASGQTITRNLTTGNYSTLGLAFSPDGKWMAYSRETEESRQGVYLREVDSAEEQRVSDQLGGASMSFTSDSQALVFSRVDRSGVYNLFSDLWIYDLSEKKLSRLSWGKRYRDPSVSVSGDWVVFTANEPGRTTLARAKLLRDERGKYGLTQTEVVYRPAVFGRVSTPRISADGRRIVFSLHENGKLGESIYELKEEIVDAAGSGAWRLSPLTPDSAALDRFPFFDAQERVYFVSNRSGVDNIYRWESGAQSPSAITNVTTGLWLPAFSKQGRIAASQYRSTGWDAVWVDVDWSKPVVVPPILQPAPVLSAEKAPTNTPTKSPTKSPTGEISDYSIFPSIWPRSWAPYLSYASQEGWTLGAILLGFDALDLHRYLAQVESRPSLSEWGAGLSYSNRQLGAVWTLAGSRRVDGLFEDLYTRKSEAGLGLSLYYPRTYSAWNPSLQFSWEREEFLAYPAQRGAGGSGILGAVRSAPTLSAELSYSGALSSREAIWPEEGFRTRLGNKWSFGGQSATLSQALWTQSHYFHLGHHFVFSPRWQVSAANQNEIRLAGRTGSAVDTLDEPDFDQLVIRGYPRKRFLAKQAGVGSFDFRFPLARIERGWHTYPLFLDTVQGMGFLETSLRRADGSAPWSGLPSYGLGVLSDLTLFYSVPVTASLQFHQGMSRESGGRPEVFIDLRLGQLFF